MFSFALYDLKNDKIILARDIAGEKPLYYGFNNEIFLSSRSFLCPYLNISVLWHNGNDKYPNKSMWLIEIPTNKHGLFKGN